MPDYLADSYATVDAAGNVTFDFTGIIHALGLDLNEVLLTDLTDQNRIRWIDAAGAWQLIEGYRQVANPLSTLLVTAKDPNGVGTGTVKAAAGTGGGFAVVTVTVIEGTGDSDFYRLPVKGQIAAGNAGEVLTSAGAGVNPSFQPASSSAYANHTPVLLASVVNPTLGAGATQYGRFVQVGKLVHYFGLINVGGAGFAAGTGTYRIDLPVNAAANAVTNTVVCGTGRLTDISTGDYALPSLRLLSASSFEMVYPAAWPNGLATSVAAGAPWAWAQNDALRWNVIYEAA